MAKKSQQRVDLPVITNTKAKHKYILEDKFEAGIALSGTEVKSIRAGSVQITESFARFVKEELFLFNAHISEYEFGGEQNHDVQRPRKLLLKRRNLKGSKCKLKPLEKQSFR